MAANVTSTKRTKEHPGATFPEFGALNSLVDAFVATTLETVSAPDATCPELRDNPEHRARVDEILARVGEVEALMALIREINTERPCAVSLRQGSR